MVFVDGRDCIGRKSFEAFTFLIGHDFSPLFPRNYENLSLPFLVPTIGGQRAFDRLPGMPVDVK